MKIKIGADPEFVLCRHGDFVRAENYLIFDSDFGTDGHSAIAELRPHYGYNAVELTANIQKLIRAGCSKIKELDNIQFLSGHYKFGKPIGGHIHLSGYGGKTYGLGEELNLVLGTLSDCIDDLEERELRRDAGYGYGWRTDTQHGGIEYRLPGSWLLSPQVAFINLWLAEATAYAHVNEQNKCFELLQQLGDCEGIIAFATHVEGIKNKDIFLKVADKVFNALPLDWGADFKEVWL